ncbi:MULTISPECIES: hypothetical protein [Luteimonas]|jgi:hypothetical protein|uniref:hypothetical protein n=1 Tax=Luteimonas TaxID=83614 RepID=UPI000C7A19EE|nr:MULTISPECIES: hypothetical protein [Luteimonas]
MTTRPPAQYEQFDRSNHPDDVTDSHAMYPDFQSLYQEAPYYSVGRSWDDYEPAFRYGGDSQRQHAGQRFEDVEDELCENWDNVRGSSRLGWVEARGAVEDAWHAAANVAPAAGDDGGHQTG